MTILDTKETEARPALSTRRWSLRDPAEIDEFFGGHHYLPAVLDEYRLDTEMVITPQCTVEWFRHHGDVIVEESTPGRQIFGILHEVPGELALGGVVASPFSIIAVTPEPHVARLSGPNDYAVISVPERWVDTREQAMWDLGASRERYARVAGLVAELRRLARDDDPCPAAMLGVVESVVDALHAVATDADPVPTHGDCDVAADVVAEAIAAIREERASSITELTSQVAASRSSLYRSFEAVLGVSPYTYMQQRRLIRLRRRLLEAAARPGVVTREAANLGAYHLGNLASSYRKLFGELPSDTAQRSMSTVAGNDPIFATDALSDRATTLRRLAPTSMPPRHIYPTRAPGNRDATA